MFVAYVGDDVMLDTVQGLEGWHRYTNPSLVLGLFIRGNRGISPPISIPNISVVPVRSYHFVENLLEWLLLMRFLKAEQVSRVPREVLGGDVKRSSVKLR